MKVLVQRVGRAAVRVDGATVGEIGRGLLVLLGVEVGDQPRDADWYAERTARLRVFPDARHNMERSLLDVGGACLVVSQFTLAADTRHGLRPSFTRAAAPELARELYERYRLRLVERGIPVASGRFQALMEVEAVNEGPVTILLDPPRRIATR